MQLQQNRPKVRKMPWIAITIWAIAFAYITKLLYENQEITRSVAFSQEVQTDEYKQEILKTFVKLEEKLELIAMEIADLKAKFDMMNKAHTILENKVSTAVLSENIFKLLSGSIKSNEIMLSDIQKQIKSKMEKESCKNLFLKHWTTKVDEG